VVAQRPLVGGSCFPDFAHPHSPAAPSLPPCVPARVQKFAKGSLKHLADVAKVHTGCPCCLPPVSPRAPRPLSCPLAPLTVRACF
jgi:hypothetical protein